MIVITIDKYECQNMIFVEMTWCWSIKTSELIICEKKEKTIYKKNQIDEGLKISNLLL